MSDIHSALTQPPLPHPNEVAPPQVRSVRAPIPFSFSATMATIGALLLLASLSQPILNTTFFVDELGPGLIPAVTLSEKETAAHPILVENAASWSSEGVSMVEVARLMLDVEFAPSLLEVENTRLAARLSLALFSLLLLTPLLVGLFLVLRRLRPLDGLQQSIHFAFGGATLLFFGVLAVGMWLDPATRAQLAGPGVAYGLSGSCLIWFSAMGTMRGRQLLISPLKGVFFLGAFALMAALMITL